MRRIYFFTPCTCGHQNKISWIQELAGETRRTNCKKCKSKLNIVFPDSPPESTSLIEGVHEYESSNGYLELKASPNHEYSRYTIKKNYNKIGRISTSETVDIPLVTNDKRISRIHFAIHVQHYGKGLKKYGIEAFPNTNGTRLNNQKLVEEQVVYLKNGDCINVGDSILIFKTLN